MRFLWLFYYSVVNDLIGNDSFKLISLMFYFQIRSLLDFSFCHELLFMVIFSFSRERFVMKWLLCMIQVYKISSLLNMSLDWFYLWSFPIPMMWFFSSVVNDSFENESLVVQNDSAVSFLALKAKFVSYKQFSWFF